MRRTGLLAAAVAIAIVARLVHGPGTLGYDALWALRWGHELLHGHQPAFEAALAPTPHPLANLVSGALIPLGTDAATTVLLALSWLSLGALAVALARLGAALFNPAVGILAAAALLTRSLILIETGQALVDLPFLALSLAALDHEVRHPREGATVPVLLALAGLLRPEAWALGLAYVLYRRDPRVAACLALAPLAWMAMDLWATGDALHSLHGTQALAAELDRPTGAQATQAPAALRDVVQTPLLWVALAGALAGLLDRERDSALPGGIIVLGLAGYLVLGLAGLPLLGRYLLLPAAMLLLFAGLAVFGWLDDGRLAWRLLGAAAAITVVAGVPADARRFDEARDFVAERQAMQDELREAARATRDCARTIASDPFARPVVTAQRLGHTATGGTVTFSAEPQRPPGRVVYRGRYWVAVVSGASCASA